MPALHATCVCFKSFAKAEQGGGHLADAVPFLSVYLRHENINETAKYLKFSNELFPKSIDFRVRNFTLSKITQISIPKFLDE